MERAFMKVMSRRMFVLSSMAFPLGCTVAAGVPAPEQNPPPSVRGPKTGQWWRYAKRDAFTGKMDEVEVARVTEIGETLTVERRREAGEEHPSWGTQWLHSEKRTGGEELLQAEVQQPWGMILVDPHWDPLQVYRTPIPLWPTELRAGWSSLFNTKFKTPLSAGEYAWEQTMQAHACEKIHVPAGEFLALRFTNRINFTHADFSRMDSVREETLWFAPEVGRWVSRRSSGTYYIQDSSIDTPFEEGSYHWDLLAWG